MSTPLFHTQHGATLVLPGLERPPGCGSLLLGRKQNARQHYSSSTNSPRSPFFAGNLANPAYSRLAAVIDEGGLIQSP